MDLNNAQLDKQFSMSEEANRVKSFRNWPHLDNSKCSLAKMAEAGFFHCPTPTEPDAVQCYVCLKELDGWEPEDDPWEEHRVHSKQCSFAQIGKEEKDLTIKEIITIESARHVNMLNHVTQKKIKQLQDEAEEAKALLRRKMAA